MGQTIISLTIDFLEEYRNTLRHTGGYTKTDDQLKKLIANWETEANRAETLVKPLLADEEFKNIFIDIVLSNYRLGCAEYNRNPAYNDTHYHYKAEEKMMYYLQDNYPELWKEIGKKVLEIDSKQSV